jgi:branched-chain amino acid transport system permease protein
MIAFGALKMGWHWTAALGAAFFLCALIALFVERLAYRPMMGGDVEVPLVSSLGFLVLLENLALIRFGSDQQAFPVLLGDMNVRLGELVIGSAQIVSLGFSLVVVLWLAWFLSSTNTGRKLRAVAESAESARILGINISRLVPQLFVGSALLTALAGILFALNYQQVSPFMGEIVGFKGIAAMIIGGMGSIWGAVLGGLLIGFVEVAAIATFGANVVDLSVYGLLLLILIVRPQGLLGRPPGREKL